MITERIHKLKTEAVFWDAVESGEKTFEVRKNDRGFQRGDIVELERWKWIDHPRREFVPDCDRFSRASRVRAIRRRIGFMITGGQYGLDATYVAFSLEPMED